MPGEDNRYVLAPGFSKLDYMEEESVKVFYESASAHLKNLESLEFELNYYGKISISDIEAMSYFKMQRWYDMLVEQKEKEFNKSQSLDNQ